MLKIYFREVGGSGLRSCPVAVVNTSGALPSGCATIILLCFRTFTFNRLDRTTYIVIPFMFVCEMQQ
jgi:hypothetical protein